MEVRLGDDGHELVYFYHIRPQAVIPLGRDPKVIESAEILAAQFNRMED